MNETPRSFIPEEIPLALEAVYSTPHANRNVELYKGNMLLTQGTDSVGGWGVVQLEWLPSPVIRFRLDREDQSASNAEVASLLSLGLGKATLTLLERSREDVDVHIMQCHQAGAVVEGRPIVSGIVESTKIVSGENVSYIMIHVVNFHGYIAGNPVKNRGLTKIWGGRAVVEASGWRITIDKVEYKTALSAI